MELEPLLCTLRKTPTSPVFLRSVIRAIWNHNLTVEEFAEQSPLYESYFSHIYQELSTAACSGDSQIPDITHEQILDIVRRLKSHAYTRLEIADIFREASGCTDEGRINRAINLAAGFLVPLNFKSVGGARRGAVVTWRGDYRLGQTVWNEVAKICKTSKASDGGCASCNSAWTFPKSFNARQLTRMAGFEIIWTSNLLDHLLLQDDDDRVKVHIFHHVKVLENHLSRDNPFIPLDLVSETMDTLALLIPRSDRRVRNWYKHTRKYYILDPSVLSLEYLTPEDRSIDHYVYWEGRLRRLKQAFDDHEPHGPLQWWRDDRKPVQWWTFWTAVLVLALTIIFGFIQSLTAILQLMRS